MSDCPATPSASFSLRPELPGDETFLLALYRTTREAELALTPWDEATRTAFVASQFQAMRRGYATMFPHGQFDLVLLAEQAVGRLVIHRTETEIRVVDVALLPAVQNQGLGTRLMQSVQQEAAAARKPVRLHVLQMNRALRFYQRLGFVPIGSEGIHEQLEWRASA